MKKVFLSLAVVCSVALVSCGGGNKASEENQETAPVEEVVAEEIVVNDSASNDSQSVDSTANVEVAQEAAAQ